MTTGGGGPAKKVRMTHRSGSQFCTSDRVMTNTIDTWLGVISSVCFTVGYLPQLIRTYGSRDVRGVSTAYWGIVVAGYVSGLLYVLPRHDPWLLVTYGVGLACALAMLLGCLVFRAR